MKKIFAIAVAVMMVMALAVSAYAVQVPLTEDAIGFKDGDVTVGENSITSSGTSFCVMLPEAVPDGETVTVHIKGSSNSDFRVWLAAGQATFSTEPLWKASENGVATGDFDVTFDLTAFPKDGTGTEADSIMFKAPSYDSKLDNFTLTYLSINGDEEAAAAPAETEAAETEAAETETTETAPETTETTTEETASAPSTGLALAVVPAVVALAAAVVTKKH